MQQIGRGLASYSKGLIIFDFVGNSVSAYSKIIDEKNSIMDIILKTDKKSSNNSRSKSNKFSNQNIIFDYASDILNILEEIERIRGDSWTDEEDNIIRENYPSMGKSMAHLLKHRTQDAIIARASALGVKSLRLYTKEEDEIIKKILSQYWQRCLQISTR